MSKHLTVVYHSPCMDGFAAACAVKKNLDWNEDQVTYLPTDYKWLNGITDDDNDVSRIPHITTHLLFVDICPNEATLDLLLDLGFYIVILDHHKGVEETLSLEKYNSGNPALKYMIAKDYSGASLLLALGNNINWALSNDCVSGEQYVTNDSLDGPLLSNCDLLVYLDREVVKNSWLYTLLEARDIWITTYPEVKHQADILASYFKRENVAKWPIVDNLEDMFNDETLEKIIKEGETILATELALCDDAIKSSDITDLLIHSGPLAGKQLRLIIGACPNKLGSNFGDTGNKSTEIDSIVVGVFFDFAKDSIGLSLRSKGDTVCLPVAKVLGGGGHEHASGASLDSKLSLAQVKSTIYQAVNHAYPFMK